MKGPPGLKKMKGIGGAGAPKPGKVSGGNMSGLSRGLSAARPMKASRTTSIKKQMFGGGM